MTTYPPADATTQWWDDNYTWAIIRPNVMVWHTTEGFSWPTYGDGAKAPHITAKPDIPNKRIRMRQHFANEHSSRALANTAGGVTTNTNNAYQIELVGTCDDAYKVSWGTKKAGVDYIHWPTAPDWALKELALLVKYLNTKFGMPMTSTVEWAGYKSPGGALKNVRLSGAKWNLYTGHLGHQHVPENSHGDPGSFPIQKVLDYAKGSIVPPTPPAPTATKTTLASNPRSVASQTELTLTATVAPAAPGKVQFQWFSVGKWVNFGSSVTTANGLASTKNKPYSNVKYRAVFTPTDATKFKASNGTLDVVVVDLAALQARVTKLEEPQTP
jgi:hypothetical protein